MTATPSYDSVRPPGVVYETDLVECRNGQFIDNEQEEKASNLTMRCAGSSPLVLAAALSTERMSSGMEIDAK